MGRGERGGAGAAAEGVITGRPLRLTRAGCFFCLGRARIRFFLLWLAGSRAGQPASHVDSLAAGSGGGGGIGGDGARGSDAVVGAGMLWALRGGAASGHMCRGAARIWG